MIAVEPAAVDFGLAGPGESGLTKVTVRNDGGAILAIDGLAVEGLSFTATGELPPMLEPGAAATLDVAWTPTSPDGDLGALVVTSDDPARPTVEVPLSGALAVPALAIEPPVLDLGEVTCDGADAFELVSTGTWPVTVTGAAVIGESFVLEGIGLPLVLAPGERAPLPVHMAAVDVGLQEGRVAVDSDAIGGPAQALVTGTAQASAVHDEDFDGTTDCYDDTCTLDIAPAGVVEQLPRCHVAPADPWNVVVEWSHDLGWNGVYTTPVIAQLTDDDSDGDIDEDDNPDIVIVVRSQDKLVAMHGDGSGAIFSLDDVEGYTGVAVADVDNDGAPEILAEVGADPWVEDRIVALDVTGQEEWSVAAPSGMYKQVTVADLEGDGSVEVIAGNLVLDGATGTRLFDLYHRAMPPYAPPIVADLDLDGMSEILWGNCLFDTDGAMIDCVSAYTPYAFGAVGDLDGDPGGEYVVIAGTSGRMYLRDSDGSPILDRALPGDRGGNPCLADLDDDGDVEIAVPGVDLFMAFEVDGSLMWTSPMIDISGYSGCSAVDLDGDGAFEVLYADEEHFRIFDGRTGAVLYEDPSHESGTLWEHPTVADLDGDGSAEIVVASNNAWMSFQGVKVYGHAFDEWASTGTTWPVNDFAPTRIDPDGAVPSPTPPWWQEHNMFRARPSQGEPAPDLFVSITDVCATSCSIGPIRVSWQVANEGTAAALAGATVALYAVDAAGAETLLDTFVLPEVPAGEALAGEVFEIDPDQLGEGGLLLRVDDADLTVECDEDDNVAVWIEEICP